MKPIARKIMVGTERIARICRHYSRDIAIAFVLAVFAAVLWDGFQKWAHLRSIQNNRKAVAKLVAVDGNGQAIEQGTGFFINDKGKLITAYHVIKGAVGVRAHLPSGAFYVLKSIVAVDEEADIAILQFDATETPSVRGLGDSDKLRVGEEVYAIGSPAGLEGTVSTGDISNLAQQVVGRSFIQFTAPISPGSSGGGLFDFEGEVIGITAAYLPGPQSRQIQNQNLNLAVPINVYKDVLIGRTRGLEAESPELYYSRGTLEDNKKEWDLALKDYQKAVSLNDKYADAYIGLGIVHYEMGQYDLEVESYEKASRADPKNDDAFYFLGTAYEDTGRYREAVSAYQRALAINPGNKDAAHDLVILFLAQGKVDAAAQLIPKLSALDKGWGNELRILAGRISVCAP